MVHPQPADKRNNKGMLDQQWIQKCFQTKHRQLYLQKHLVKLNKIV